MTLPSPIDLLLVEDNPNDLELTLRVLKRQGFSERILSVRDGVEALDYVFQTGPYAGRPAAAGPKVIFLDLKLPKVTGMEVLQKVKSDPRTRPWPVVILTSSRQERDVAEAYHLGANSYVVKPVDFNQFASTIADLSRYWLKLNQNLPF